MPITPPHAHRHFGGVDSLVRETQLAPNLVKNWLSSQDAYTLHKPIRKKFTRRKTFAPGIDHLHQLDLADVSNVARANDGRRFILVVVDVFSKYCWLRAIKDKTGASVTDAYADILSSELRRPTYVQYDNGREFLNSMFQDYLRLNGIKSYTSQNYDVKCAVVERLIRTIKAKIYRYMTHRNTERYIDALQDVASSYNAAYHRSIKTAPASVNAHNADVILRRLYGIERGRKKKNQLVKNDRVRLSRLVGPFAKSYSKGWTDETFFIEDVLPTRPTTYIVKDESGEIIGGKFYSNDIQKVTIIERGLRQDEYEVEKIIATRKRNGKTQHLVRWSGYSSEHDSWVDELVTLRKA